MIAKARSEPWWEKYRRYPYLEHLSDDELIRRFDDVAANAYQHNQSNGRIGVTTRDEWLRRLVHVKAELNVRGLLPDHGRVGDDSQIPDGADPVAAEAISGVEMPDDEPYLVKYGEARHVRPIADRGEIRVSPASDFEDDPSLDPAQRDEELHLRTTAHPDEVMIRTSGGETVEPVGNVDFVRSTTTDYYFWSLSSVLDVRLFRPFGSDDGGDDACFLIREPGTFLRRFCAGLQDELPGWRIVRGSVAYVDPVYPSDEEAPVYFAKDFRYAYQREFRVVAVPPENVDRLDEYVWLKLGPCEAVGEIIEVPRD